MRQRQDSVEVIKHNGLPPNQEALWKEFNDHFRNPNRNRGKDVNHHDFLDPSFIPKDKDIMSRKKFFSQVGHQSIDKPIQSTATLVDLGRDRLNQTKRKYDRLQAQCFEVALNKEKAGIPKWLQ